ncbi:MAG: glycoside hydrolase family 3 C-terminal domain-containing protein [Clostridia bacterium]|nr:glycoside hydrolase family 3 C-terminal domain-containing protein [Clostridia bacterium]
MSKSQKSKKLYFIFLPFVALLLALGIAANCLYPMFKQILNGSLGSAARASEEYVAAALENSKDVNIRLQEEGSVLLKNENVLPVKATGTTPINVYGIISAHHYLGGSGSGSNNATGVSLKTALESVGFQVNSAVWDLMEAQKVKTSSSNIDEGSTITEAVEEISLTDYAAAASWSSAKSFSEYAIVTFGRGGAEGSDLGRNILELGSSELALLQKLHEEGFKVITLINSSNVMELGPVMENSDAILWVGGTGLYGTYGIANLISGKTNPSGRLVDTWMYNQETSASYYPTISTNANFVKAGAPNSSLAAYTNYNEGIYVGYKWYETADAENYWDTVSNDYGTKYEGVVAYPFGYGLSYTEFNEEIISAKYENGTFTFTIKAENIGETAGKDVIELYVEKPYANGGLEVSKVELVAFEKTQELEKDGDETFTITVNEEELASYDSSANGGKGSYVLLDGTYTFYLASSTTGAHCWKSFAGDDSRSQSFTVNGKEYSGANKRSSDAVAAVNLLEVTDNDTGISSADGTAGFQELSRKDGFKNAPETISQAANENGKVELAADSELYRAITSNFGRNTYTNYNKDHLADVAEFTDPSVEQKKVYTITDLCTTDKDGNPLYTIDEETGLKTVLGAVDYDDPRWDVLISQMSLSEMSELIGRGGYGTIAVSSIGKITGYDYDGPTGYSNFLKANMNMEQETTGFCSEPIMAATWNVDLVEEYGKAVGKEGNAFSNTGWYAPGMNIHRTAFGGRLGEYFSEDSLLTGMMGASVAYGAFEMGIYSYAKHFAFNEIETQRNAGMNCFMSEQTAREIYLRPFEIAIKQGKLTGLMSSFMYMNAQWNGGDYNLMSGIVRKEWNFKGVINTDLAGSSMMGAGRALCAGTDMLLSTSYSSNATLAWVRCDDIEKTDAGICAMKTAVKHILFAYASAAVNREVEAKEADTSLVIGLYAFINVVAYGGAAVLIGLFSWRLVLDLKKSKKSFAEADGECETLPEELNSNEQNKE